MPRSQLHRKLAIGTPLGDDVLYLRTCEVTEELGRPFTIELELLSEKGDIKFDDILGHNVSIRIETPTGHTRFFNGYVSRFAQSGERKALFEYQATLVPWFWLLSRTSDCRIFQEKTVPDILKQVFRDHGFTNFRDDLTGSYRSLEYCVQYRETDFNFLSRLMEQEGIYYYFEHENGKHTLVLVDDPSAHPPLPNAPSIKFYPPQAQFRDEEHMSTWYCAREVQPKTVAMRDFDYRKPRTTLDAKSAIARAHAASHFEMFDYPGEYVTAAEGEKIAAVRIQEYHSRFETFFGATDVRDVRSGFTFKLTDPSNALRPEYAAEYLIIGAAYTAEQKDYEIGGNDAGGQPLDFKCRLKAIPSTAVFRSGRTTVKPTIPGPQTAVVVGKSGEEIWTEEHGCVKVRFHWDRYSNSNEKSSCWVRVSQNWAGKRWGSMFLPRRGQEVIVDFLEGDPDRPIVTGRVYNGENKPPYKLPDFQTISTTKTNSSKGGGGFNEVRFEDKKGEEQLFIHAEKQFDLRVKASSFTTVGGAKHTVVHGQRRDNVKDNHSEYLEADRYTAIDGDRHTKIVGDDVTQIDGNSLLTTLSNLDQSVEGDHRMQVAGSSNVAAGTIVLSADSKISIVVGGSSVVVDSSGVTLKGATITLDGGTVKINSGPGASPDSAAAPEPAVTTEPEEAYNADKADPGEVAQTKSEEQEKGKGKYKPIIVPVTPGGGGEDPPPEFVPIEFQVLDAEDHPVANEDYKIIVPGEPALEGKTDSKGVTRIEKLRPGSYDFQLPKRVDAEWIKIKVVELGEDASKQQNNGSGSGA